MTSIENIQLPPNDYELEKKWLNLIYTDNTKLDYIDEFCFYDKKFKAICKAIKKTNSNDTEILAIESKVDKEFIDDNIWSLVSINDHDYIIKQLNLYKKARFITQWFIKADRFGRWLNINDWIKTIEKLLEILKSEDIDENMEDIILQYYEDIEADRKEISSWFDIIDKVISMQWWQLVVIAGRPSMWKTTVMQNLAIRQSQKHKVWFVSLEMWNIEILDRFICMIWGLKSSDMKNKKTNIDKITTYLNDILSKSLFISDKIYTLSSMEQYIIKNKLDVCYIDYLWLIQMWGKLSTIDRISEITRQLKLIAKNNNCIIVLGAQLSRECEKRIDKRPILSDLRDSGSIEQDADIVWMLYRDDYYDEDSEYKNKIQILVRKQRNWECKQINIDCDLSMYRLLDKWFIK